MPPVGIRIETRKGLLELLGPLQVRRDQSHSPTLGVYKYYEEAIWPLHGVPFVLDMGSVLVLAYLHCYQFSDIICVELRIFLFLLRRIVYRQPNHLHVIYKLTEQQKHMTCLQVFIRAKMGEKKGVRTQWIKKREQIFANAEMNVIVNTKDRHKAEFLHA